MEGSVRGSGSGRDDMDRIPTPHLLRYTVPVLPLYISFPHLIILLLSLYPPSFPPLLLPVLSFVVLLHIYVFLFLSRLTFSLMCVSVSLPKWGTLRYRSPGRRTRPGIVRLTALFIFGSLGTHMRRVSLPPWRSPSGSSPASRRAPPAS